jgi:lipopolysaccharide assembly protein A
MAVASLGGTPFTARGTSAKIHPGTGGESSSKAPAGVRIMRVIQAALFLAFLGAVGLFAIQNTRSVTVGFWTYELTAPVALVIVAVYLLGMMSGWTVVAFVRRSIRKVGEPPRG